MHSTWCMLLHHTLVNKVRSIVVRNSKCPGNGLLMQAGGQLLILFVAENLHFNRYFSEVEHPHNLQYTFLQVEI